eukprot:PhM_4_TR4254/c1_g1_i1/m.64259/K13525/VCP, CDC48; transitional endoplasmic reticulum ATPase
MTSFSCFLSEHDLPTTVVGGAGPIAASTSTSTTTVGDFVVAAWNSDWDVICQVREITPSASGRARSIVSTGVRVHPSKTTAARQSTPPSIQLQSRTDNVDTTLSCPALPPSDLVGKCSNFRALRGIRTATVVSLGLVDPNTPGAGGALSSRQDFMTIPATVQAAYLGAVVCVGAVLTVDSPLWPHGTRQVCVVRAGACEPGRVQGTDFVRLTSRTVFNLTQQPEPAPRLSLSTSQAHCRVIELAATAIGLNATPSPPSVVLLHGPAGSGKSGVVSAVCHRHKTTMCTPRTLEQLWDWLGQSAGAQPAQAAPSSQAPSMSTGYGSSSTSWNGVVHVRRCERWFGEDDGANVMRLHRAGACRGRVILTTAHPERVHRRLRDRVSFEAVIPLSSPNDDKTGTVTEVSPSSPSTSTTNEENSNSAATTPFGKNWDDISGLEDAKKQIRQAIVWPLRHREQYAKFGLDYSRGVLLHGPPGCGKTSLVRALAAEAGIQMIHVDSASAFSSYVGSSEEFLRSTFARARQSTPCVVFFDEVEAIAATRSGQAGDGNGVAVRLLSTLLTEMDGVTTTPGVIFTGATNLPDAVDPAMMRPGRFDKVVAVPPPTVEARVGLVTHALRRMGMSRDALDAVAAKVAMATEGMSAADVECVCTELCWLAVRRVPSSTCSGNGSIDDKYVVSHEDVDTVLAATAAG